MAGGGATAAAAGGGKKKATKVSWQELQAQYGDKSRNPLDNLPTSSRSHSDQPRDSFRSSMYGSDRRERREDRDEGPSRADESGAWRSMNVSSSGSSSFRGGGGGGSDRPSGRSDDGVWRTSRPATTSSSTSSSFASYGRRDEMSREPTSSSFGSYGRRDEMMSREPDSSGRPRLALLRPSADRLATAQEQQKAAKAAVVDDRPSSRPNPFGDARPVVASGAAASKTSNPFGDAKPVEREAKTTAAEPWRPRSIPSTDSETSSSSRFARPSDSEAAPPSRFARPSDSETASSSRFARPADRPRDEAPVKLAPSLPPRKAPVVVEEQPQLRAPSPTKPAAQSEPEPPCPVRSALDVSMDEGTWVTADELADCIGLVSLDSDDAVDALGHVLALSLARKTVLLPSAVALIPRDRLPGVLRRALVQLTETLSPEQVEDIVGDVSVVEALGIDAALKRDEIVARLTEIGLQQFAPKENAAASFEALCAQDASNDQLVSELKTRFPRKSKVPVEVAFVVSEFVVRKSLDSGAFNRGVLDQHQEALAFVAATVKTQTHMLFGVQEAWFARGTTIKRSGKAIFEALYEMRLISVDAMVAWMHDKERVNGKRPLLLQCGGYISDLQNSAIAHQFENSDSEDSVDLDGDFPQANRNYDDY